MKKIINFVVIALLVFGIIKGVNYINNYTVTKQEATTILDVDDSFSWIGNIGYVRNKAQKQYDDMTFIDKVLYLINKQF